MPHWRTEAKENARLVRHTKEMVEVIKLCRERIHIGDPLRKKIDAILDKVLANSTEPVE